MDDAVGPTDASPSGSRRPDRVSVVAGLGNPGAEYEFTRHNVGFLALERLRGAERWQREGALHWLRANVSGQPTWLLRPLSFMNRSGQVVAPFLAAQCLAPEDCLVLCDDVSLPWGRLRLRREGAPGGHNGLKSIQAALQSNAYPRLRIGVGAPEPGQDLADFVLSPLEGSNRDALLQLAADAALAVQLIQALGVDDAMNRINPVPPS